MSPVHAIPETPLAPPCCLVRGGTTAAPILLDLALAGLLRLGLDPAEQHAFLGERRTASQPVCTAAAV